MLCNTWKLESSRFVERITRLRLLACTLLHLMIVTSGGCKVDLLVLIYYVHQVIELSDASLIQKLRLSVFDGGRPV